MAEEGAVAGCTTEGNGGCEGYSGIEDGGCTERLEEAKYIENTLLETEARRLLGILLDLRAKS